MEGSLPVLVQNSLNFSTTTPTVEVSAKNKVWHTKKEVFEERNLLGRDSAGGVVQSRSGEEEMWFSPQPDR